MSRWLAFVLFPYNNAAAERWLADCQRLPGWKVTDRSQYELAVEVQSIRKVVGSVSLARISLTEGTATPGKTRSDDMTAHMPLTPKTVNISFSVDRLAPC